MAPEAAEQGLSPKATDKPLSSWQQKLAVGDDNRSAAYLNSLDALRCSIGARVEHGRSADLGALVNLDLSAESDPPVAAEMHRQGAGGRAGGRILRDAVGSCEHARLPAAAGAGEAVDAAIELGEGAQVRPQGRDGLLALQFHVDVKRSVRVRLHRQAGALDAQRAQQLGLMLVWPPGRDQLLHAPEDDPVVLMAQFNRHEAESGLKSHTRTLARGPDNKRRAKHWVPSERELVARRKDA